MKNLLEKINKKMNSTENILCTLQCSFDLHVNRNCSRPGLLIATERRMLFYGVPISNFKNEIFEEFLYENISSLTMKKSIFGTRVRMYHNDEYLKFNKIINGDANIFIETVNTLCEQYMGEKNQKRK
ncbi:hypothetical protein CDB3_29240 [Bacillus sp. CDB3]|nr:hypothetical protein CDB3_29240 [Bacillus sp. CDB3]